jgi:hypothetical protein
VSRSLSHIQGASDYGECAYQHGVTLTGYTSSTRKKLDANYGGLSMAVNATNLSIACVRTSFAALAIGVGLAVLPAAAEGIEPDADKILHSMADYLSGLKTFTAEYDADDEVITTTGQKLQYSASGSIAAERPGKMHLTRKGSFIDAEVTFDGINISVWGKRVNVYAQLPSPGPTIDEAIEEIRQASGLDIPGGDLLAADPYAVLTEDTIEGKHVGDSVVGGVECDHLAFRNPRVDWQVWIQKGDQPLPLKFVITTKWVTGAPQYTLRLHDWNVAPQLDEKQFAFTVPPGATKLEGIQVDEVGQFAGEIEQ